jgi:alpha-L-rhamnosidase
MLRHPWSTTITEQWNGDRGSLCHTTLGAAIDEWFFSALGGIKPDEASPGYKKILFEPYIPPDLEWVEVSLQSCHGTIVSGWSQTSQTVTYHVVVPPNTTASVRIPSDAASLHMDGTPLVKLDECDYTTEGADTYITVGSGAYHFTFPPQGNPKRL